MRGGRRALLLAAAALLLAACTEAGGGAPDSQPTGSAAALPQRATTTMPTAPVTIVPGVAPADLAVATSAALFTTSTVAVVAPDGDTGAQALAAAAAVHLGVPLLLGPGSAAAGDGATGPAGTSTAPTSDPTGAAPESLTAELGRLGATTVLAVGTDLAPAMVGSATVVRVDANAQSVFAATGMTPGIAAEVAQDAVVATVGALDPAAPAPVTVSGAPSVLPSTLTPVQEDAIPSATPPTPLDGLVVLATPDVGSVASAATARAAGASVVVTPNGDPRTSSDAIESLAATMPATVLALGDAFGTTEALTYRLGVAETGVQLPGSGQVVFPGRRMVALYGNPTTPALGVLGEQPLPESITRAQETAAQYDELWPDQPVVPAFELIASVASAFPGPDKNYSTEMTVDDLRPWIDAARDAGVYVVLDLQPGRTDFLTQAKLFEPLLLEPNVGLALDPEWRLKPNQVHLEQIGTVTAAEINTVVEWLADLTRAHQLPQKLLMLHQFKLSMISDRDQVDTSRDELAVLIHVDGNGPPGSKYTTYASLTANPPPHVWWGWKNFYDEDSPMFTPAETVAVTPAPVFVSYQ